MNDCSSCPSRLAPDEVRAFYGKDFGPGVDACATFGHVLGGPGLEPSKVQSVMLAFGKDCASHGVDRPASKPEYPEARITAPLPDVFVMTDDSGVVMSRPAPTPEQQSEVPSCKACRWFVPENIVRDEIGYYLPMCAATGRLILPKRLVAEPKKCGRAEAGANLDTTAGMALRPEYDDAFNLGAVRVGTLRYEKHEFVEPTEYASDRPVSLEDQQDGIRAFRRVFDPNGSGAFVDLPIFNIDFFSDAEQAKIPRTGDDEHPEWYVDHQGLVYTTGVLMMELDFTPCLIGAAGTGKTEFFRHLAWLMCLPFDRISVTRSTEVDDLAGKWLFEDGETRWQDGRVASCWETPGVLDLDEPNVGPDEVWQFVRPLTDNSKQLVLDAGRGQRKARNNWRFFGMTMNPSWDVKNVGANEISDADGNRLSSIAVGLPPEDVERKIIVQACLGDGYEIPVDKLDKIMAIAGDIRAAVDDESINASWGIRPQAAVARSTKWFDLVTCYKLALADRLDPSGAETIIRIVAGYES